MNYRLQFRANYLVLIVPGLAVYLSIVIFPILFSLFASFTEWSGLEAPQFVGLKNYGTIFNDPVFLLGLRNNVLIVLVSVAGQIPIGFLLAYIIYRRMVRGAQFYQAMIFLPVVISPIVVAILWNQIFSPAGVLTQLIRILLDDNRYVISLFEHRQFAIVPILLVILWYYTGIYMVIFIANLQKIPPSMLESAVIDGAKERHILLRIVLPQMVTVVFTTAVFAIAGSLKSFDLIFAMTSGGPSHYTEVIAIYMYINTFRYYKYGYGSAISIVIIVLSLGLIGVLRFAAGKLEKKYEH